MSQLAQWCFRVVILPPYIGIIVVYIEVVRGDRNIEHPIFIGKTHLFILFAASGHVSGSFSCGIPLDSFGIISFVAFRYGIFLVLRHLSLAGATTGTVRSLLFMEDSAFRAILFLISVVFFGSQHRIRPVH